MVVRVLRARIPVQPCPKLFFCDYFEELVWLELPQFLVLMVVHQPSVLVGTVHPLRDASSAFVDPEVILVFPAAQISANRFAVPGSLAIWREVGCSHFDTVVLNRLIA